MAIPAAGHLNVTDSPLWGSRSVDCFEKLEQIGEGTYGGIVGVYTLKYIELLIAGKTELLDVSDKNFDLFRNELAHNIFNYKWNMG